MQLIEHSYGSRKPSRYYLDGRRVDREAYETAILVNRIGQGQHCCFMTKVLNDAPDCEHVVHTSVLTSGRSG